MPTYRTLGRTGVKVSPLVLGTDNFDNPTPEAEAARLIDAALDAGINLIDTANSYRTGESERIIGRALKANGRRDQVLKVVEDQQQALRAQKVQEHLLPGSGVPAIGALAEPECAQDGGRELGHIGDGGERHKTDAVGKLCAVGGAAGRGHDQMRLPHAAHARHCDQALRRRAEQGLKHRQFPGAPD